VWYPAVEDIPNITTKTVEVPHPSGPLGIKDIAETSAMAAAPTIAKAIYDAIGVRVKKLLIYYRFFSGF
jgi:CO/xanthine dehydrogenase Mo-binding subunit